MLRDSAAANAASADGSADGTLRSTSYNTARGFARFQRRERWDGFRIAAEARELLAGADSRPLFLWVHLLDAHWPYPKRLAGVPVVIAHGSLDPVIPAQFATEAAAALSAAGANVLRLQTPVPHMVDPEWIDPIRALVDGALAPGRSA